MSIYLKMGWLIVAVLFSNAGFCLADPVDLFNIEGLMRKGEMTSSMDTYKISCLFGSKKSGEEKLGAEETDSALDYGALHKYLGYSTVVLAGLTAVTSGNKDVHYGAAYGTVAAAIATLATGYMEHSDRFDLEDGWFTEDNNHILLGTIGAIGCIAAVALADSGGGGGHNGVGVFGGGAMTLSIIMIRW